MTLRARPGSHGAGQAVAERANARTRERANDAWLVALAALVAVPAGGIAFARGFDGLYGQDAFAYFDYATGSVRDSILRVAPLEAFFWPPGYPLLVAVASLAIGPVPLAGQLVSLLMGALVPFFTALLVRELWPEDTRLAVLSGVVAAVPGQLWQSSIVVMADTTGLALATFGAWALVRYATGGSDDNAQRATRNAQRRLGWLVAASAALAYATLARWIYGLVALPLAAYAIAALPKARPRTALLHALAAGAVAAALLLPLVGPPIVGLLTRPAEPAPYAGNFQVYSWSPLNALRQDFFTADGHLSYSTPNGAYYALAPANFAFFGPLLAPWLLLGLIAATRTWPRSALLLLLGWAAVVYAFHAGAPWQNFRFSLAYLPPLAILAATGVTWTARHLERMSLAVYAFAAIGMLVAAAGGVRLMQGFVDRKDDDLALARWVQSQASPGSQLLSFGPTLTFRHYTSLPTLDLFDLGPADVDSALAAGRHTYVVLDPRSVEDQWLGLAPSNNFNRLRAEPGLTLLGTQGNYSLFRVGSG